MNFDIVDLTYFVPLLLGRKILNVFSASHLFRSWIWLDFFDAKDRKTPKKIRFVPIASVKWQRPCTSKPSPIARNARPTILLREGRCEGRRIV